MRALDCDLIREQSYGGDQQGADCARDRVWDCLFSAPALPVTGGIGSPLNPLAIK